MEITQHVKCVHGYVERKLEDESIFDSQCSLSWPEDQYINLLLGSNGFARQEQLFAAKQLCEQERGDVFAIPSCNRIIVLCHPSVEDITLFINFCPKILSQHCLEINIENSSVIESFINTLSKNTSGMFTLKRFEIIGITQVGYCCLGYIGKGMQHYRGQLHCKCKSHVENQRKRDIYGQLLSDRQLLYPDYEYIFLAIIIAALNFRQQMLKRESR